ncbi:unnamed protein product [Brachionus calyciflorus]|uniref:Ankyrin repeat and LEM domain-containing protein 1 n=1 Tax=Brachionus calyciflorus TaxID=104777 RepID=A0A813NNF0_9BILA|nr:unnamed protein product [Brachionus calyciflorus]
MDVNIDQNLFEAVLNEDYKETLFLLSIGADPNRLFKEHNGISSFHIAVGLENDLKFTRLFIKNNANVNIKSSKDNWTPLHVCAYWNKFDSLQLLILNQADPFILSKDGKSALDIAIEHKSEECIKILTDYIKKLNEKGLKSNRTMYENRISLSSDESILSIDVEHSYSNIKTSTFDESHLEFHLKNENLNKISKKSIQNWSKNQKSPQKKSEDILKDIKNNKDLEKLISNLIDMKLEKKETEAKLSSPILDSTLKSANISPFVNHSRGRVHTPSIKSNSSTQTKITNKRFLSPDKLPAYVSPKIATPSKNISSNSSVKQNNIPNPSAPPPTPPPLPPVPTIAQFKITKETQTTGKMVKLKQAVPVAPPDLIQELQSKFKEKEQAKISKEPENKFKNFFSKFSNSPGTQSLKPSDYKFKKVLSNSPVGQINEKINPVRKDIKLRQRSSSLVDSQKVSPQIYSNLAVKQKVSAQRRQFETPIETCVNKIFEHREKKILVGQKNKPLDLSLMTNDESCKKSSSSFETASDSMSISSVNFSLCNEIQQELNKSQRKLYESEGYSNELIEELINKLNLTNGSDVIEANMFNCFQPQFDENNLFIEPKFEWREGNVKSAFNYLLIDPRLSHNLPKRAKNLTEKEIFRIFISSIFYIGKGSRARPYAHLYDTLKHWKKLNNLKIEGENGDDVGKISKKMQRIIEIWNDNKGVVSLHCFQSVIPSEAYTREAAMMDSIGLKQLTNMKKGNYYGEAKEWNQKKKNQLGVVLLKRACAIFLAEGERQITPIDI